MTNHYTYQNEFPLDQYSNFNKSNNVSVMFCISTEHWEDILTELSHPTQPPAIPNNWKPSVDFGLLPCSLDSESWSTEEWGRRSFTFRPIPVSPPATLVASEWDAMAQQALKAGILDPGWSPHMAEVRRWLTVGTPEYLQHPGTIPTKLSHHITPEQIQMTLESIRSFQTMVTPDRIILYEFIPVLSLFAGTPGGSVPT